MQLRGNRKLRVSLVLMIVIAVLVAGFSWNTYKKADAFINQLDLKSRPVSGTQYFAGAKKIFQGQSLKREEVIEHLKRLGFSQTNQTGQAGSYFVEGDKVLQINPHLSEFNAVRITFDNKKRQISRIEESADKINWKEVARAELESEAFSTVVMMVKDEKESSMSVRRYVVQPEDVMETLLFYAVLASEDHEFMEHHGISFPRFISALLLFRKTISTITMQAIKNAISLNWTKSNQRKIDELFQAACLEMKLSKAEIFALYSNSVPLGGIEGTPYLYGFSAASEVYFGKRDLKSLTLSEACILAAILNRPNYYVAKAVKGDYEDLTKRRDRVLNLLHRNWADKFPLETVEAAKKEKVVLNTKVNTQIQQFDVISGGFLEFLKQNDDVQKLAALSPIERSRVNVYTSIDADLMRESERILRAMLPRFERQFPPVVKKDEKDTLIGTIVAIEPQTGEIVSMFGSGGGEDGTQYTKLAVKDILPPASVIKVFETTLALNQVVLPNSERFTAAAIIDPKNCSINGWQPKFGVGKAGRVRSLLSKSRDDFACYMVKQISLNETARFYNEATGGNVENPTPVFSIGFGAGSEITALQLARAISIYSRNGSLVELSPISKMTLDGKEIPIEQKPSKQIAGSGETFVTVQMLKSVLGQGLDGKVGTARRAFNVANLPKTIDIAGKTGSGPQGMWFVSVSPKLVVAVQLKYKNNSEIKNSEDMFAADTAAIVWAEFMKSVQRFRPDLLEGKFEKPDNVVEINIDPSKGCQTKNGKGVKEYFLRGTEPRYCESAN